LYELIFGHRRYVAAKLAKLETIPANIKKVADDQILEYQVTENLQRKDVHPMDEAVAFRSLMDSKKYSVGEIAARFAKKPEFVTQRLKLNDLTDTAQKLFKQNKLLLGHAILLARLTANDQVEVIKNQRDFGSVSQMNDHIERNIVRDLSKASFDTKDATLFPQAGACTTCPKRSGCNQLLFADVKTPDRCFDSNCFSTKSAKAFTIKLQEIIETKPEVHLVRDRYREFPKAVNEYVQKMKVKVLIDDDDCADSTWSGSKFRTKAKGFFLNGWDAGKIKDIYLPGKAGDRGAGSSTATKEKEKSGKLTAGDITEEIKRINDREKRSKELDLNKVHKDILEQVDKKKKDILAMKHQPVDRGIMIFILLQECSGFAVHNKFKIKGFDLFSYSRKGYAEEMFKQLSKVTDDQLAILVREIAFDHWLNKNFASDVNTSDTGMRLIAQYAGIDIKSIEKDQQLIADKRNERIKKRISDLNEKKKELPVKKSKPAKK